MFCFSFRRKRDTANKKMKEEKGWRLLLKITLIISNDISITCLGFFYDIFASQNLKMQKDKRYENNLIDEDIMQSNSKYKSI